MPVVFSSVFLKQLQLMYILNFNKFNGTVPVYFALWVNNSKSTTNSNIPSTISTNLKATKLVPNYFTALITNFVSSYGIFLVMYRFFL